MHLRKTKEIRKELRVKIIHAREHRAGECSKEEVSRVRCRGEARTCRLGQDEPLDPVLGVGGQGSLAALKKKLQWGQEQKNQHASAAS